MRLTLQIYDRIPTPNFKRIMDDVKNRVMEAHINENMQSCFPIILRLDKE